MLLLWLGAAFLLTALAGWHAAKKDRRAAAGGAALALFCLWKALTALGA